jgi:ribulose-5-phosphate 4-epimerase/fuculose-1-phosphate aldolase
MSIDPLIGELVTANRILAAQGVVDSFGHVSARSQRNPERFLLSRARAPDQVDEADIMEFDLEGNAIDASRGKPYLERFIHAAIYAARPDVGSVVHSHSYAVVPFGVTGVSVKPVMHVCSAIGREVPVWDIEQRFGATDLLVSDLPMGRDLASTLRSGSAVLMRGHGATVVGCSVRQAVSTAIYLQVNCNLQLQAIQLAGGGKVKYLSDGEMQVRAAKDPSFGIDRAWESWSAQVEAGISRQSPGRA